jgi:regulatory helix-turn-helix LysR family protein
MCQQLTRSRFSRPRRGEDAGQPAEIEDIILPLPLLAEGVMEMHQVRYFLAVAGELNFTRASEKCNVTEPSLSRAIKLLEEELRGPLFCRDRESTHLTDLGQMVLPHLQSIYNRSMLVKHLSQVSLLKNEIGHE